MTQDHKLNKVASGVYKYRGFSIEIDKPFNYWVLREPGVYGRAIVSASLKQARQSIDRLLDL